MHAALQSVRTVQIGRNAISADAPLEDREVQLVDVAVVVEVAVLAAPFERDTRAVGTGLRQLGIITIDIAVAVIIRRRTR